MATFQAEFRAKLERFKSMENPVTTKTTSTRVPRRTSDVFDMYTGERNSVEWAPNGSKVIPTTAPQQETDGSVHGRRSRREDSGGCLLNDLEVFKKPMCLVSTEAGNALKIETEVVTQIAKIDWPLVVVSVVGLYRTGKSYLMNRLADSTQGFALGDTIESKTKGIWVWCKIHPEMPSTVLVLLDTEGLGDVHKGDPSHDNKIFTIATLLCNCLVYNMKGAFDQDALGKLTFVTEMAKHIRFKGHTSEHNENLTLVLPDFVLCLRDFTLKLVRNGEKISENEYLKESLEIQKDKTETFNKQRECIRNFFPRRKCFTFPLPGDSDVVENLERLQFKDLSVKFQEATTRFVSYIYKFFKPKELLASKPINGQMFATLATSYVTAIAQGDVPDVDEAILATAKVENARVENEAFKLFEAQMDKVTLPVATPYLKSTYTEAQQKALEFLRRNVVHDKDGEHEMQAQKKMDNRLDGILKENKDKIREKFDINLREAYASSVGKNMEKRAYYVAGGHKKYQMEINELRENFLRDFQNFDEQEALWHWFDFTLKIKTNEVEKTIIDTDKKMSKRNKEAEMRRNEENFKKALEKQEMVFKDALVEQRKTMEAHYENIDKDRTHQLQKEKEKNAQFLELKLDKEQAERELREIIMQQNSRTQRLIEDERKRNEANINMMREDFERCIMFAESAKKLGEGKRNLGEHQRAKSCIQQ